MGFRTRISRALPLALVNEVRVGRLFVYVFIQLFIVAPPHSRLSVMPRVTYASLSPRMRRLFWFLSQKPAICIDIRSRMITLSTYIVWANFADFSGIYWVNYYKSKECVNCERFIVLRITKTTLYVRRYLHNY